MRRKNRMNKSEKRAQTFLYMGVLLTLIAADWQLRGRTAGDEGSLCAVDSGHCHLPGSQRRVLLEASEAGSSLYPQE